jgi:hypothetical protein
LVKTALKVLSVLLVRKVLLAWVLRLKVMCLQSQIYRLVLLKAIHTLLTPMALHTHGLMLMAHI